MNNEKIPFRPSDSDTPITEAGKWTPAKEAVKQMFLDNAHKALEDAGCGALEFLAANPGVSKLKLAERLNRGVSAHGLIMAVYEEAVQKGVLRATARDLLIREINSQFPDGWPTQGNVRQAITIAGWVTALKRNVKDPRIYEYATALIRNLAVSNPPLEGWKPRPQNDPLIDDLFDRFWPVAPAAAMGDAGSG